MQSRAIEHVLRDHAWRLMAIDGVLGTGVGLDDRTKCIRVFVDKKTPELEKKIPPVLEGYFVSIEETGGVCATVQTIDKDQEDK